MVEEEEEKEEGVLFLQLHLSGGGLTLSFPGSHSWRRAASEKSKKIPPKILVPRKQAIGKRHVSAAPSTFDAAAPRTHRKTR